MSIKKFTRNILRTIGYDIGKYHYLYHPHARRMKLLDDYAVDTVLDIGANIGQYGMHLREDGYTAKIISFEPISDVFSELKRTASHDALWRPVNVALGDYDGTAEINVSGRSVSSSLHAMLPRHIDSAPETACIRTENIQINRLDTIFEKYCDNAVNIYMKVDAQGYGMEVMKGAEGSLKKIRGIQMEVSLVQLYENEVLLEEMVKYLRERGFSPMSIEPGFADKNTGQLLQADFIFYRTT